MAPEIKQPLMKKYFRAIEHLSEQNPGQLKMLGDGFALILKIDERNGRKRKKIIGLLEDLKKFTSKILNLIKECEWPPEGFRLRTTAGYADEYKTTNSLEYISDLVNLCQQLLHIRPDIPMVCHITSIKLLTDKERKDLGLAKVNVTARDVYRIAETIDANDIRDLFEVPLK